MHAHGSLFISGKADFKECSAKGGKGGGAHTTSDLMLRSRGSISCNACDGFDGGCLHVSGGFSQQEGASSIFQDCTATRYGGALAVKDNVTMHGSSEFIRCTSGKRSWTNAGGGVKSYQ